MVLVEGTEEISINCEDLLGKMCKKVRLLQNGIGKEDLVL